MSRTTQHFRRAFLTAACITCFAMPLSAAPVFWDIRFDEDGIRDGINTALVRDNLIAAANEWTQYIDAVPGIRIDVLVRFDTSVQRAGGRSFTSAFVGHNGQFEVWEQALSTKLRDGFDVNGSDPDVEIIINPNYAINTLWFDPDPGSTNPAIPGNRVDAYSILMHELGHALAFNGWRNEYTGAIGSFGSTFDDLTIVADDGFMYFVGEEAMRVYGSPVPLTWGNIFHVGNNVGFPGSDLLDDLMNGIIMRRGVRYGVSLLDLAIAYDSGVPINPAFLVIPAPTTLAIVSLGLAITSIRSRRSR